ncbi:MAG: ATP-binding cassette domain-containing protein [Oscillatoriales cyanobacterium]|nr:MAG: ATP-binding cassette domain-containing protein [Oscillatoriales cyanobacterium]
MTQAASLQQIQGFLAETDPFDRLSPASIERLLQGAQFLRYRVGQPLLDRQTLPAQVAVLFQGQVRVLGFDERSQRPVSLKLATPGEVFGWGSLMRGIACETAIASTEVTCISIPATDFIAVLAEDATFRQVWESRCSLCELFGLLSQELQRQADRRGNLKDITLRMLDSVQTLHLKLGPVNEATLERLIDPQMMWLLSGGQVETASGKIVAGDRLIWGGSGTITVTGDGPARVVGLTQEWLRQRTPQTETAIAPPTPPVDIVTGDASAAAPEAAAPETPSSAPQPVAIPEIPFAPEKPPELPREALLTTPATYPHVRGRGPIAGTLACFQMINEFIPGLQFRKDRIRRLLEDQMQATGQVSMQVCGAIAQSIGLRPQLIQISGVLINRLKAPAIVPWKDGFAVIYDISETRLIMASPEEGVMRKTPQEFLETWGESGMILLLEAPVEDLPEKFGLSWFIPWILPYKRALIEVVVASFFVQTFGLVQPIITQVIIDKVLGQGSIETMDALGFFMLGVAVFEGVLNILRTYLFIDAMNRIDMNVGSAIISHLMRLPLGYFDIRRVGELAGRVNERDSIRNFLTGTALTVFLNAIFSVIYIVVMVVYSWLLTLVALAVVPILAGIIVFAAPIIRQLIRKQAERRADVDSYMVEVISGSQTVKAQNIETKVLWQWQERYARMIQANFKTIMTGTTIGGATSFLNSLSTLALLWAGAYLVIGGQITLGQLIAFKILAGNVTGSLLSLVGAWQQVQEISISVERLADIVDSQPESSDADRNNIPMPEVTGSVKFTDLSFRFAESGPLQLANVNLEFPPGTFVGIVGESGSGKSTLMKLLQRLYAPTAGYIQIDGYDISKVELYSLRRQIGMVLQDTLLFTGTVQENIMLANPDATTEEVIHAAKVAAAHDFIMQLPNGYNTVVGERGTGLSGGQKQRIAIARTVLQQPKLLILDEATSALDYNSERQVCNNLAVEFRNRTVFFITHRLNTVLNADCIILMDKGAVVEQGTHEDLMALKGRYYCLFQQQEGSFS